MLGLIFSISIASSLIWLVSVYKYIIENIGMDKLLSYAPEDMFTLVCTIIIPIAVIWIITTFIIQGLSNVKHNRWLRRLLKQSKTSIEYSEAVTRTMIEATGQVKSGFTMNNIDFTISDLNEIIAEIISRTNIKTKSEILDLWKLYNYGSKWGFSKSFLEYTQKNEEYNKTISDKCHKDKLLAGSVLEFCSKYIRLIETLEKHDKEKLIQESFENGVMGRVFSILAPIADGIHNKSSQVEVKEYPLEPGITTPDEVEEDLYIKKFKEEQEELKNEKIKKESFFKKIFSKKVVEKIEPRIDQSETIIEEKNDDEIDIFAGIDDLNEIEVGSLEEELQDDDVVEAETEIKEENTSNFASAEEFFTDKNTKESETIEEEIEEKEDETIDVEEYIEPTDDEPVDLDIIEENIIEDDSSETETEIKEETKTETETVNEDDDPNREKMIADLQKQWEEIKNNQ